MKTTETTRETGQAEGKAGRQSQWLTAAMLVMAHVGLFAAGILTVAHVLKLPIPCGGSQGCASVAAHPMSRWMGVPIAIPGLLSYLMLIPMIRMGERVRGWQKVVTGMAGLGTGVSLCLLYLSIRVIQATCVWCVVSGIAMTLVLGLSMVRLRMPMTGQPLGAVWMWVMGWVTAIALGTQAGMMQRASWKAPVEQERLRGFSREDLVAGGQSLGSGTAPVTILVHGDMACWGCRLAHDELIRYQAANPRGVRLVFRHLPLGEIRGHEVSRKAAAAGELAAEKGQFWEFLSEVYHREGVLDEEMLMQQLEKRGWDRATAGNRLADAGDRAWQRVKEDEELAGRMGVKETPTFILMVEGEEPVSARVRMLERLLGSRRVVKLLARARQTDQKPGEAGR